MERKRKKKKRKKSKKERKRKKKKKGKKSRSVYCLSATFKKKKEEKVMLTNIKMQIKTRTPRFPADSNATFPLLPNL